MLFHLFIDIIIITIVVFRKRISHKKLKFHSEVYFSIFEPIRVWIYLKVCFTSSKLDSYNMLDPIARDV